MISIEPSSRMAGIGIFVGYLGMVVLLFLDPTYTLATADDHLLSFLLLLVLPVAGLVVGLYTYLRGPFHGPLLFLAGTYLGVVGLTMVVGFGISQVRLVGLQVMGAIQFGLATVALLVSVKRFSAFVGLGRMLPTVQEN